jgi:hypothetical protein
MPAPAQRWSTRTQVLLRLLAADAALPPWRWKAYWMRMRPRASVWISSAPEALVWPLLAFALRALEP